MKFKSHHVLLNSSADIRYFLSFPAQLQKIVRIQSVEDAMKKSVISICFKLWKNTGMSTACVAVTAERHSMKANVTFATAIYSVGLIFFGK